MKEILKYFGIRRSAQQGVDDRLPLGTKTSVWPQWLALFSGILIQPYFEGYRSSNPHVWHFVGFGGWFWFALITSGLIFPSVYRKIVDESAPIIVQLGPIFAAGLGWESLMGTVMGAVSTAKGG